MAITVVCPGCHKRFSVADQHAGKEGPCPNCKQAITIPKKEDEVVIHAPEHGPTDASGRPVLKTTKTADTKFNPIVAGIIAAGVLVAFVVAFLVGDVAGAGLLTAGAILLGPPLAYAGYWFLRDSELEPYSGGELWVRSLVCGLAFALAWGVYSLISFQMTGDWFTAERLEIWQMLIAIAAASAVGILGSFAALDLEPTSAFIHVAFYFLVTVLLRMAMGLAALPGMGGEGS